MPAYRLTNKALDDLRSIARYTEKTWGPEQRNRYLSKLNLNFQMLAHEPHLGHACDDIKKGYRKHHVGRHLIFYRRIAFQENPAALDPSANDLVQGPRSINAGSAWHAGIVVQRFFK